MRAMRQLHLLLPVWVIAIAGLPIACSEMGVTSRMGTGAQAGEHHEAAGAGGSSAGDGGSGEGGASGGAEPGDTTFPETELFYVIRQGEILSLDTPGLLASGHRAPSGDRTI
jgi:hypothetical protein